MKFKNKSLLKVAALSIVAAFSFGLAISCVSNHKQNINKVFAEGDISTTWSYNANTKALSCTYASNYPNGFIMDTNQVGVRGVGDGEFELSYQVLGYPSNNVEPDKTDYGTFTLIFRGYYDPTTSTDGPYGSITASPVDISGLDSGTNYEIYLKVEPTGDMNQQGTGGGTDENAGTWTWNENTQKLSFQFNDTATAGYVSTTSQTMVYGHGNGTFDIGYDLWGTPANATTASNELLASKTITLYDGYYNANEDDPAALGATITGSAGAISGLESYLQITIKVDVTPSGDLNTDGWRVNDGDLYFYVLADVNPASIDSITWNNSSGNGTGEAILSVTISTNGGSFQQVYQINNPTFNPELEGTSGTTLGNTTVEGISEWSDQFVLIDISNKSYSLGESTQEIRYTITYYPNGADGDPVNDSTDQVPEGDAAEYMLLDNMFSRPDYIFLGWSTDSSSQTPNFEEGDKVDLRSDISYYAIWEHQEPDYYTRDICFDPANGEEFINRVAEGETLPLSYEITDDLTPTYEGHTFIGWYYDGYLYQPGEVIRDIYENITLVAQWEAVAQEIRYTITYYPNGADGEPSPLERETSLVEGDSGYVSYEFEQQPENYTKSGYNFVGWSIDYNAVEAEYLPNVSYSVNQDLEVFAVWVEVSQEYPFEVLFVANDGTEKTQTVNFTCPDESTVFEFPSIDEIGFERENYRFLGWSTESDGEVISDSPTIPSGLSTFYAIWELEEQIITYTISYYPNGGQGEPFTRSTNPVEGDVVDVTYTFEGQPEDFINGNLRFEGWSTDEAALEAEYTPYESYTINENKVVYAVWVVDEYPYKVTFDANGGTGTMESDTFVESTRTIQYELPSECNFTYSGFTFKGWSTESDGEIISGNPVIDSGTTTFYAIWEEDTFSFKVVFNANGGSGTMESDSFTKTTETFEYSLPQTCGFTYPNHEFIGWSLTSNGDIISGATVISSGTTNLYAIWKTMYSYTVTFDGNDATSGSTDSVILSGDDYNQTIVLPECGYKKEGYEFVGWGFTSDAPMSMTYQPGTKRTDITADTTFYAIWVQTFTISFDANGGTGTMENVTVPKGTAKIPECKFSKEGYTFNGWAVGSPQGEVYQVGDEVTVSENYVLYATWKKDEPKYTYTVTFDGNGATGGSVEKVVLTGDESPLTIELPENNYTLDGYSFYGWSLLADGGIPFDPGTARSIDGDTTFYAYWVQSTFTITFDGNGATSGSMNPTSCEAGEQTVPPCGFEKEGYTFAGWAVGSADSTTILQPDEKVNVNKDYVLYATWTKNAPIEPEKNGWRYEGAVIYWDDSASDAHGSTLDAYATYSEKAATVSLTIGIYTEKDGEKSQVSTQNVLITNAAIVSHSGSTYVVSGYFNELDTNVTLELKNLTFEKENPITPEQQEEIKTLLPEESSARTEASLKDLSSDTANNIIESVAGTKAYIEENYSPEEIEKALETVQTIAEAAVVVGAAQDNAETQAEELTKSLPANSGLEMDSILKDFYAQQMRYLLGEEIAPKEGETPTKGIKRSGEANTEVDIDEYLNVDEYDQMINFVDNSVEHIEQAALQIRECSHESVKVAVNHTITTITQSSFRDFDKEAADAEFVENVYDAILLNMQGQVLTILEKEYAESDHSNKEKDQQILDEIEAVRDIEVFENIVIEVLREKYTALTGTEIEDPQEFFDEIYWPTFEAWALDKESPTGITLEELTNATIESTTSKARNFTLSTDATRSDVVLFAVLGGSAALAIAGAAIIPTILKKRKLRKGESE